MEELFRNIVSSAASFWDYFRNVVDILIVAYLFYWTYNFLLNTRAVQLLKGVVVIFIVAVISALS